MDVLRLAGVPGAGKSTVGWRLAERIAASGERVAFVDIDQLGMCYPVHDDDPERWALKERALARVLDRHRLAGVDRVVVPGVVAPDAPPPGSGPDRVRALWLDASPEVRRDRLALRGWTDDRVDETVRIGTAEVARRTPGWSTLDTAGHPVDRTVDEVASWWGHARATGPGPAASDAGTSGAVTSATTSATATVPVLWVTGPRCAGASTVAWSIVARAWRTGHRAGFADLRQLSFVRDGGAGPDVDLALGTQVLGALTGEFADDGAGAMVVVAPLGVDPSDVARTFPGADVSFVRLDAPDDVLRDRAWSRTAGGGPVLAGDDLAGAPPATVDAVVASAMVERRTAVRDGEVLVDASAGDPSAVAERVLGDGVGGRAVGRLLGR